MNTSFKILIIGAGQIGSRHLQGVLKSTYRLNITLVDPSLKSLKLSKLRASEIKFGNSESKINYRQKLPKNKSFEICIISTNADVRAEVTKNFLKKCQTKHIIFEKILFQKNLDFEDISKLIKRFNVKTWVNLPRRIFYAYQEIKDKIDTNKPIKLIVNGSSWGMACNSIHFIDLFSYLTNIIEPKIIKASFSNNLLKSKRGKKFYEVNGLIKYKIGLHSLEIYSENSKSSYLNIKIKNKDIEYFIDEMKGIIKTNINGFSQTDCHIFPNQSELSGRLIDHLIEKNYCELTTYKESCKHHLPLLNAIRAHLSKILKIQLIECPIT